VDSKELMLMQDTALCAEDGTYCIRKGCLKKNFAAKLCRNHYSKAMKGVRIDNWNKIMEVK
jgi:hypothetical protein